MELADAKFDNEYDGEDFEIEVSDTKLLGQMWKPEGAPKFVYMFVHGLGAYVTFKKDFFYVILEKGGIVFGCDHLGHGRSEGSRVSCTVDELIEENVKVINLIHEKYPELPLIVHGHSMGGLATIMTILKKYEEIKDKITAVITEAPWISKCPQRELNIIERFGINILQKVWGTFQVSAGVEMYSPDLDQNWVKMCDESPYYCKCLTPRLYLSVEEAHEFVHANVELWPQELPLLFLQGEVDALVDAKGNDKWIQAVMAREDMKVTYKLYPDVPHVTLKCPKRAEIIKDMFDFIDKYIA